jgi:uncharacterized protein (TIGR02246 family)
MGIQTDQEAIRAVIHGMVRAWNSGSGEEFAACCEEDADFVNIFGMHERGRRAIAVGHDNIFRTIYAGSVMHCNVTGVRFLCGDIALVHVRARLQVPQGPMAGEMHSVPSMILRRTETGWSVTAFHNTLVGKPPV